MAMWAVNEPEIAVAVVGALLAGVPIVPINPKAGSSELSHIVADSAPELVLAPPGVEPPVENRVEVDLEARGSSDLPAEPPEDERPRSSSTRRAPPGRRRASCCRGARSPSNLDALAEAWGWTGDDVLAHALPLFHVHGLVLGMLGPLRRGGAVRAPRPLRRGGDRATRSPRRDDAVRRPDDVPPARRRRRARRRDRRRRCARARLLVSGSAAAPGRRARADRAAHRPADRRALRHDRDADEHRRPRRRRAPRRRSSGRRSPASSSGSSTTTAHDRWTTDDETIGEVARPRPEPLPRLPQPAGRDRRGDRATAGSTPATSATSAPDGYSGSSAAARPT